MELMNRLEVIIRKNIHGSFYNHSLRVARRTCNFWPPLGGILVGETMENKKFRYLLKVKDLCLEEWITSILTGAGGAG